MSKSRHKNKRRNDVKMNPSIKGNYVKGNGLVKMKTNLGDLTFELYCEETPLTCENFLTLCTRGYYDGIHFHRLIKNFMIQGGDPLGNGTGGESIWGGNFQDEFVNHLIHGTRGILSMANSGKSTNRSQFFITFAPAHHLDGKHTVFGKLIAGARVLRKIEAIPTNSKNRPHTPIKIVSTTIIKNPFIEVDRLLENKMKKQSIQNEKGNHNQSQKSNLNNNQQNYSKIKNEPDYQNNNQNKINLNENEKIRKRKNSLEDTNENVKKSRIYHQSSQKNRKDH
ncbi:ring-type e3 ubiquitin-protein ligase ppil2 [Anaeramoeba flamelloides]|uniref:Peptidyl-prolyl cis-trans isomerase n=1 Tax=Anaeramoeba flamelloides TaxID=1746091 RepID=A0AAV7ZFV0_9EUKA|nr:ring-type e3 ubiquitin-protein ligase ppil2 [Anaeramoeba flamelloides]